MNPLFTAISRIAGHTAPQSAGQPADPARIHPAGMKACRSISRMETLP